MQKKSPFIFSKSEILSLKTDINIFIYHIIYKSLSFQWERQHTNDIINDKVPLKSM